MRPIVLLIGVLGTVAILVVATTVAYALYDAETATASALEGLAAKHLRTEVSIAETAISLKSGTAQLIGLQIQNPPGFSSSAVIQGPEISIEIDAMRSTPELIVARKIILRRPLVLLEINEGQANLARLTQALTAASDEQSNRQNIRLSVEEITVEDGELSVVIDKLGEAAIRVPLPDSRLKNIGIEDGGVAPKLVLDSLTAFIVKITERATRRIDIAEIANERGVEAPTLNFKTLLAQ